jgi:lantibiotic biosynthesis protein
MRMSALSNRVPGPLVIESHRREFLTAALSVANDLVSSATWDGERCTWAIATNDPKDRWARHAYATVAGASIYQGTSGIALFLTEAETVARFADYDECIEGGLRHALTKLEQLPYLSFYTGRVGVAYVLIRYGLLRQEQQYVDSGTSLALECENTIRDQVETDLIGGTSGVIVPMLQLSEWLGNQAFQDIAVQCGQALLTAVRMWPKGWSWRCTMPGASRDLTGLAHGASGHGAALLELYNTTGQESFRFAAEQAFKYESQFLNRTVGNWPDFRDFAIAKAMTSDSESARFRDQLKDGRISSMRPRQYMAAWCHGAPGICLSRARAFELLGEDIYRDEAIIAANTTAHYARTDNYSLCHGCFGNDSILISAQYKVEEINNEHEVVQRALDAAEVLRSDIKRLATGSLQGAPDASLMLGTAGFGYHFLRLASPDVPDILLLTVRDDTGCTRRERQAENLTWTHSLLGMRQRAIASALPVAIERLPKLGVDLDTIASTIAPSSWDVGVFVDAIRRFGESEPNPPLREVIPDAIATDLARLTLLDESANFNDSWLAEQERGLSDLDERVAAFRLAPNVQIVEELFDWKNLQQKRLPPPMLDLPQHYLVYRKGDTVVTTPVSAFAGQVLASFSSPRTVDAVATSIVDCLNGGRNPDAIRASIERQIQLAIEAGILLEQVNDKSNAHYSGTSSA